jgi:NHLM bacteriocin system ABC transporter ATP-binding protein
MSQPNAPLDARTGMAGEEQAAGLLPRVMFDSRRPQPLDHHGYGLQVTAGHVDLFATSFASEKTEWARHHLFRVESGDIILGLPQVVETASKRVQIIAVGGPGAQALKLPQQHIEGSDLIAAWIMRLGQLITGSNVDWTIREAEADAKCELVPGERRRASAHDLVWSSVEAGTVRLMGTEPAYQPDRPAIPLASGMWIESAEPATTVTFSGHMPSGENLWRAIDQFHLCVMACIHRRLSFEADQEQQRLVRRIELARLRTGELFDELSAVIVRTPERNRTSVDADPLLSACRMVTDAMQVPIARPPERISAREEFEDILEIARASRLRVRRILLRQNWWKLDVGPLVAWYGQGRNPVALIRSGRHYLMKEPGSDTRRVVNATIAAELAPEAAMFYPTLPASPVSLRDLLTFSMRQMSGNVVRILVGAVLLGLLSLVTPLITQVLVNSVIPRSELDQLVFCAAALAVTAIGLAGAQVMQAIAMLRLEGVLDWKLQAAIIDRLIRLPASLFRQYTVGDLVARSLGIDASRRVFTGRTMRSLFAGVFCWFSFILMFYYDLKLALIATVLAAVRAILIILANAKRLYHENRQFNLQGKVQGFVLQLISGVGKLRVAAATIRALAVWAKQFAAQKRDFIASQRAANALNAVETSFPLLATLVIFAAAEGFSSKLTLDLGAFLAFFAAFGQSMALIGDWATGISESLLAIPLLTRIRPLIDCELEVSEERRSAGPLSGSIELSRVSFRYEEGGPLILDNISLQISPGEYVAIVGPSGSGKSTIFRLLLGFEKPNAGAIFFDGKAVDTLDVSDVRRQMGVVLQNGRLASGSIYENICGGVQLPMEQVWEAVRLAGLEADLKTMPMGLHTVIAEGVSTISGGQRQRLMIARAIARRPRILLLDEATSALDNQTQSIVSNSLGNLNVTRIVIAHRLSTVREADRIIVLVDGKVVQSGRYSELSAAPGMFADFARRQLL